MSQNQRYRSGPQQVATGKIKAGVKAEIGDLMFRSSDEYLYPASTIVVDSSGSGSGGGFTGGAAKTDFKSAFAGTLIEGATSGNEEEDSKCMIGYDADYEYPLDEAADSFYPPGYSVEVHSTGSPGALASQVVKLVATRTTAIALISRGLNPGDTTVTIRTVSSIMGNPLA